MKSRRKDKERGGKEFYWSLEKKLVVKVYEAFSNLPLSNLILFNEGLLIFIYKASRLINLSSYTHICIYTHTYVYIPTIYIYI